MKSVWIALTVFSVALLLAWGATRTILYFQFEIACGGHLKRAADANTIPLAEQELRTALDYIEKNNLKQGSTHLLFATPDLDIGFWYTNLRTSLEELESVSSDATKLEKSNLLMKLRETLLDHGEKGVSITVPEGITVYPTNWFFALWCGVSSVMVCVFGGFWAYTTSNVYQNRKPYW